jgi:hypothetical protein
LGGVPGRIRYDNLKAAVARVLEGRCREETERFIALRSHYGFSSFFCRPGLAGSHEKGGVEGEIGRFRRRHLVPVPEVNSLTELDDLIAAADWIDDARHLSGRQFDIGTEFASERTVLGQLPLDGFETGLILHPRVDRHSRITVRSCRYSVPVRFVGRRVRVLLRASEVIVFDRRAEVTRHHRSTIKDSQTLVLDHYLEVLAIKPGALPGATALAQARRCGVFTAEHEAFWSAARTAHGDSAGTRELIDVLLLHRYTRHADVVAGLAAAVSVGATNADVVAVEGRRHASRPNPDTSDQPPQWQSADPGRPRVVSLTERRLTDPEAVIAGLPPDTRALPSVAEYDELLTRRATRDLQPDIPATGRTVS